VIARRSVELRTYSALAGRAGAVGLATLTATSSCAAFGVGHVEASRRPKGANLLAANRHAEVYTAVNEVDGIDFAACLRRARRSKPIDLTGGIETVPYPNVTLKGTGFGRSFEPASSLVGTRASPGHGDGVGERHNHRSILTLMSSESPDGSSRLLPSGSC